LLATPIKSFATFTADYYLYDIASKKIKEIIRFSSARANLFLLMKKNSVRQRK
jgi:hypothetical protein